MNEHLLTDLSTDERILIDQMSALAANMKPDAQFADDLERRLLDTSPSGQPRLSTSHLRTRLRVISTLAAIFTLLTLATLTIPPLRAIAQEVIDTLFNRTDADRETVEVGPRGIISLVPYFFGTIEEAQAKVDFTIHAPTLLPDELILRVVNYSPEEKLVSLTYGYADEAFLGTHISVDMGPLKNGWSNNPLLSVGESADVTSVQFAGANGDVTGEFVKGFWMNTYPTDNFFPEQPRPVDMRWDSDLPVCRLRWQDAEMIYEIWSYANETGDACRFGMDDLVAIAESMR
jgi:hypothetical protein